jgi:hypothetical protein
MRGRCALFALVVSCWPLPAQAGPDDFKPDPLSVQWYGGQTANRTDNSTANGVISSYGPAYRYPQAGWIVLHIEGEPYERGYQHGRLLAPEIAAAVRNAATQMSPKSPADGWHSTRTLVNALFLRRYAREYLEEMRGIADGAAAAGARYESRPIDLVDIAAYNCWPEIETLGSALEATPTGLEGIRFPHQQPQARPAPKPMHCSAFAATGPATKDGKVVFGHITMFGLYASYFYNVWLDVKPAKGHRVFMQSYPGGIQSGMDYYYNDAGLLCCETTIGQTRFDIEGLSLASRIREALQYADTIDAAAEILKKANNGLYTNEWLLADIKTNEIAMFELGTHKTRLWRSSKNEWFGGTPGFYWGCNNTKDLQVRLETVASVDGRPANAVFHPSDRDVVWQQLYEKHKGRIDADFGKEAFTTPPIAAYHSLDAKFTTTDLAKELKTWALFGPPLGRTWQPTQEERQRYADIKPLVSNPWTILHAGRPAPRPADKGYPIADLRQQQDGPRETGDRPNEDRQPPTVPAWHGTLLPAADADTWLATAFADYERLYARARAPQQGERGRGKDGPPSGDRERLGLDLFGWRANYLFGARAGGEVALDKTRASVAQADWYRVASGRGVWLVHELRRVLKDDNAFEELMDSFGREHAGKAVTTADFQEHVEKKTGRPWRAFFDVWLHQTGLPRLRLADVRAVPHGVLAVEEDHRGFQVTGSVFREGPAAPTVVDVTVETGDGEVTQSVELTGEHASFSVTTEARPRRVIVDKYGQTARANGGPFTVTSFTMELEKALIVYGTGDETPTNREAAEALQRALVERGSNYTVPVKSDREVTEDDLRSHHLLLVGRPDSNRVVERFRAGLPVGFGRRSFTARHHNYAHALSAVLVAAPNPLDRRYSLVVVAGLSAEATVQAAPQLVRQRRPAEVVVLANQARPRSLLIPAPELVHECVPSNGNGVGQGGR